MTKLAYLIMKKTKNYLFTLCTLFTFLVFWAKFHPVRLFRPLEYRCASIVISFHKGESLSEFWMVYWFDAWLAVLGQTAFFLFLPNLWSLVFSFPTTLQKKNINRVILSGISLTCSSKEMAVVSIMIVIFKQSKPNRCVAPNLIKLFGFESEIFPIHYIHYAYGK